MIIATVPRVDIEWVNLSVSLARSRNQKIEEDIGGPMASAKKIMKRQEGIIVTS